ncbi:MAG: LysM peptidoglycan-binding domain-containing protein [Anaerolineales bacterium]|nr:LysM peptidoglycan-binding domain-containing protein [Anaerolineales bacterium]
MKHNFFSILLLGFVVLTACSADAEPQRPQTAAGSLQPWQTPVPSRTPLPPTATVTVTPVPTATPQLYVVAAGDTMLGIAFRFGVSPESLAAANPDVSAYAMSVGQELRIPAASGEFDESALPAPLEVTIAEPTCYTTLTQGMWCFALVVNPQAEAVENISARFDLLGDSGEVKYSRTAFLPLDILAADERLPLFVYFPNVEMTLQPRVQLLTAMEASNASERYLQPVLGNTLTQIDWTGRSAYVSGEVSLPADTGSARQVWIVATAVDAAGRVVGVRRWEAGEAVAAGATVNFEITVASLGTAIAEVWVASEARR